MSAQPSCGDQAFLDPFPALVGREDADPVFQFVPGDRRGQRWDRGPVAGTARCACRRHHEGNEPVIRRVVARDPDRIHK